MHGNYCKVPAHKATLRQFQTSELVPEFGQGNSPTKQKQNTI